MDPILHRDLDGVQTLTRSISAFSAVPPRWNQSWIIDPEGGGDGPSFAGYPRPSTKPSSIGRSFRPVAFGSDSAMATQHKSKVRQFPTHIDIPPEKRAALIEMLNQHPGRYLPTSTSQVKQAHWNVKGKDFYQLHLLFDEIAGRDRAVRRPPGRAGHLAGRLCQRAPTGCRPSSSSHPRISDRRHRGSPARRGPRRAIRRSTAAEDPRRRSERFADEIGDPSTVRPLHRDLPGRRQATLVPRGPHPDQRMNIDRALIPPLIRPQSRQARRACLVSPFRGRHLRRSGFITLKVRARGRA